MASIIIWFTTSEIVLLVEAKTYNDITENPVLLFS